MRYLVRLSERALRDIELIYEFIHADTSEKAFAWFRKLTIAIDSLKKFPERGAIRPGTKKFRYLAFGNPPNMYRIIYGVDKRRHIVDVLHVRHGARKLPSPSRRQPSKNI